MESKSELYRDVALLLEAKEYIDKEIKDLIQTGNTSTNINIKRDLFSVNLRIDVDIYVMILRNRISALSDAIGIIMEKINN